MQAGFAVFGGTGAVSGLDLLGDIAIERADAAVDLQLDWSPGAQALIDLNTGPITLSVPATIGAQLDASTAKGAVLLTGLELNGDLDDSAAEGSLGDGNGTLTLHTGAGDVVLVAQ